MPRTYKPVTKPKRRKPPVIRITRIETLKGKRVIRIGDRADDWLETWREQKPKAVT